MPKLLFVGIVERTCKATVVREIKGITDCFAVKDDSKNKAEPEIKVSFLSKELSHLLTLSVAHDERFQLARCLGFHCRP